MTAIIGANGIVPAGEEGEVRTAAADIIQQDGGPEGSTRQGAAKEVVRVILFIIDCDQRILPHTT